MSGFLGDKSQYSLCDRSILCDEYLFNVNVSPVICRSILKCIVHLLKGKMLYKSVKNIYAISSSFLSLHLLQHTMDFQNLPKYGR